MSLYVVDHLSCLNILGNQVNFSFYLLYLLIMLSNKISKSTLTKLY